MNTFKRLTAFLMLFLYCTVGFADQTQTNTLTIGKPTAVDKTIEFNSAAGKAKIKLNTSTQKLQFSNDGSNYKDVGAGGGGAKNFVTNFDFEADTSGYTAYKDAAATTPVDGTGGSPTTLTLTKTTVGGEVLAGTGSLKVAKSAANSQGEGFSTDIVVDRGYLPGPASISFMQDTTAANYAAGDLVACVYDKDLAALVVVSGADVGSCKSVPKQKGIFKLTFNFSSSDDYRVIFHFSTTNATASNLFFDEINVNPLIQIDGVPQSEFTSYVPTFSGNGSKVMTLALATYKRDGDVMEINVYYNGNATAAGAGATIVSISIPAGYTIDTNKIALNDGGVAGKAQFFSVNTASQEDAPYNVIAVSTSALGFIKPGTSGFFSQNDLNIARTIQIAFTARVPISQWAGSANIVNGPNIEYACNTNSGTDGNDTTSFSNDPDGCLIPQVAFTAERNRQIRYSTAKQPGDKYTVEYRAPNGYWQPLTYDYQSGLTLMQVQPPNYYGFNVDRSTTGLPATDLNLTFARYSYPNNTTFGGAGASWAAGALVGYRYRVRKESGVAATAYAPATATSDGFVSPTTQTFGGVKTFSNGLKFGGSGTQGTLNDYEVLDTAGPFTEFSGTGTAGTAFLRMTRIGNQVTGQVRFVVSGTAGSLVAFGLRDATGVWPTRFQPASLNTSNNFHIGYCAKGSPSSAKFYIGLLQSGGTNYLFMQKDAAFGNSEDTGWCSFSYQLQ